jgi:STI1 domain
MPPPPFGGAAPGTAPVGDTSGMLDMLRNPEMQKMLYPYLPEPMRNPETFEWMLNNPEYRAQLEGMLSQQMGAGAPPAVQELMNSGEMNPDKMKAQFDAMGMTPEEFIQKVMSDPDLATSMTKPSVMAAIAECTQNPMNIFKYQADEEVMRVFEKMSSLFPQAGMAGGMPGGGGFPGMPPVVQAESSPSNPAGEGGN